MRRAARWAVIASLGMAMAATAHRATAQDQGENQDTTYEARIHVGGCAPELGEVLTPLSDPLQATGPSRGQATGAVTATSFTSVPFSLDELLEADHAIGIRRPDAEAPLACGEVGGALAEEGNLVVGLREQDGSGFNGVAYLAPSVGGAQTDISVLLVGVEGDADDQAEPTQAPPTPTETDPPTPEADRSEQATTPAVGAADAAFSGEERQYATTLARQSTLVIASLRRVDELFENPNTGDEGWTNQLAAELTLWQILNMEAQEIEPPAAFDEVHATYREALELLDSAAADIFSGLAEGDEERVTQGTDSIEQAVQRIGEASRLVDELAAERES